VPRFEPESKLLETGNSESAIEETTIVSDLEYLRTLEHEKHDHRHNSHHHDHHKRNSIFAELHPRAEQSGIGRPSDNSHQASENEKTLHRFPHLHNRHVKSPWSGPEAILGTNNLGVNNDDALEETEDISPEVRRELERHHLDLEEKRVAEAAVAYREEASNGQGHGGRSGSSTKSSAIQDRVRNLLDESTRTISVKKTASGYGKYTELEAVSDASVVGPQPQKPTARPIVREVPDRDILTVSAPPNIAVSEEQHNKTREPSSPVVHGSSRARPKPSAPPKPVALRTGMGARITNAQVTTLTSMPAEVHENWEEEFSKRYPSLSLDVVEREILPTEMQQRRIGPRKVSNV